MALTTGAGATGTRPRPPSPIAAAAGALADEQDRWFLWAPVLYGIGIALYFALPVEPLLVHALLPVALAGLLWAAWRRGAAALLVASALLALSLGLAVAKLRADWVAAPVLERQTGAATVTGWLELVEPRPARGERITIRVAAIDGLAAEATPRRVRIRTLTAPATPQLPGDGVRIVATLSPPAAPALPGGFDFGRSAWFQGLGAVGFARGAAEPATIAAGRPADLAVRSAIERVRQAIGARIRAALPGETGAIANALVTGERGGISEATNDAFRDSGLFHILSISGLHMVIMAGSVFLAVRFLLSLVPVLALRFPIKKWAATAAAAGALAYLLISGASFPTVRSWIMISIMYLAVLLDRPAVALRNVAVAALVILTLWPESLIDPGFQMSFAAVVSLVAAYEWLRERRPWAEAPRGGLVGQCLLLLGGIMLTTLIASLAVAPVAAWHFHKSQQYAMIANLIAIPICNIVVMPAALATLVAMPLGLERWPLAVMGLGIEGMVWTAYAVAGLPGAVGRIPSFSSAAFALMVAGGLWLTLWRRRWRLLGLVGALSGVALAFWREPPDVLVGRGGRLVAVRGADGRLEARADAADRFDLARWLEHDGDARPPDEVRRPRAFRCDWAGCVVPGPRRLARPVAVSRHAAALADDCRRAAVVIVPGRRLGCAVQATAPAAAAPAGPVAGAPLVIGEPALSEAGAHAIHFRADGTARVRTVAAERGRRPWSMPRRDGAPDADPPAAAGSATGSAASGGAGRRRTSPPPPRDDEP